MSLLPNMMQPIRKLPILIMLIMAAAHSVSGQSISWGPSSPAVQASDVNTCFDQSPLSIEFENAGVLMNDVTIEVQLDTGVFYVTGSMTHTSSGSINIVESDISDLNRPIFEVGRMTPGSSVDMIIDRRADCEAMALSIAGSTFKDSVRVYEGITEVTYTNGLAGGTSSYGILYGLLSITGVSTSPSIVNVGSAGNRSMTISNGAFGYMNEFYFAEVFPTGELSLSNFIINPLGSNYTIPAGNISIVGDSLIVHFTAAEISAIDGSAGTKGDADSRFEADESFILSYDVIPLVCSASNTFSSEPLSWFGCSYNERCQTAKGAATISVNNNAIIITPSNVINPSLDFCDTVFYSVTLTNTTDETAPPGSAYAKDFTAILGLRHNNSPIATLDDNTHWGTTRQNTRFFTNHTLNGVPVTLPVIPGLFGTQVPHLPPDYFDTDPDGPGGLSDEDGDGYFDDLPKDASVTITYGVYIMPRERNCGLGRADYMHWEHISADISWFNDCSLLMSPIRQEMNYTNHIRDYLNATFTDAPTNVVDGESFDVGIRPHMRAHTMSCNGTNSATGDDMDWVTKIIMPPGVSMAPGYDMSIYNVTGNLVTVIDKYDYVWTTFPLTFYCAAWDGASSLIVPIMTEYICSNGLDTCYFEEVHCVDLEITPQCLSACTGVNILNFTPSRISESWTDATQTALVDLDDPGIVTNYAYPFDTIELFALGVISDTMTDQISLRINYSPENGGNIFNYLDGTIEIVDIDGQYNGGQTNYIIPLTGVPVINDLGGDNYEMIFDLSSYRTSVNASYLYGQSFTGPSSYDSDTIIVRANVVLSDAMDQLFPYAVDDFRAEFFTANTSGDEVLCGSWSSELFYERPIVVVNQNVEIHSGCGTFRNRFFLSYRSESGDNFPNEYRPPVSVDSIVVRLTPGWTVDEVWWLDDNVMDPSDYDVRPDGTLTMRRPAGYNDFDKLTQASRSFSAILRADCRALQGINHFDYTAYYKGLAYLTDESSHIPLAVSDNNGGTDYTGPTFTISPINQTAIAYSDTISWNVRVCNTTSDMDVDYNWLALENDGNLIVVDSIVDVTGGSFNRLPTSALASGGTYVEIGSLDQGECSELIIFSSYTSCVSDTLDIAHGWSCSTYPALADVMNCSTQNELYILPQFAQISTTITTLASTPSDPSDPSAGVWGSTSVDMCNQFPMEMTIVNSQPGFLFNTDISMLIPSLGQGLQYVTGSMTIEVEGVDIPNMPRSIGSAAESSLVAASSASNPSWDLTLADLDPANFGSGQPLEGTTNTGQNEFTIRWLMEPTCQLISGDRLTAIVSGNNPCGNIAPGSNEQIQSYPVNIIGAIPPYFSFFTTGLSSTPGFEGCDDHKSIDVEVLISGGATGPVDTLEMLLPNGLGYEGMTCITPGLCPVYAGSTIVGNDEVVKFTYPPGVSGVIEFSLEIETDTRGDCFNSDVITLNNKVIIGGLLCGASACPSSAVFTGSTQLTVSLDKPILSVSYNSLTVTRGNAINLFYYDMDISNTGLDHTDNLIAEFYCINPVGDDIIGPVVAADTVIATLSSGVTTNLSGEFLASCDPDDGVGILLVPEYDNCYCGSLESIADKSTGLLEIPHDLLLDIPPFFCPTVTTNAHIMYRVRRKID